LKIPKISKSKTRLKKAGFFLTITNQITNNSPGGKKAVRATP